MKFLAVLFMVAVVYGLATGHVGGALLASGMAGFMLFADRWFREQDRRWDSDPLNAPTTGPDTAHKMVEHDCECMRDKL